MNMALHRKAALQIMNHIDPLPENNFPLMKKFPQRQTAHGLNVALRRNSFAKLWPSEGRLKKIKSLFPRNSYWKWQNRTARI
jgi:hypothetical protein